MEIPESKADWRFARVARTKGDQMLAGRGFVEDGTLLWLTTVTETRDLGRETPKWR